MTGLVLEGGGVRGIYIAGVLDVFMEAGICFDGVIGVSAGAIHGCSFLSEQKGRSIRPEKPLPIGRLDSDPVRVQQVYDTGRADAEKSLAALKAFLTNS